jgi:hypothetical protein
MQCCVQEAGVEAVLLLSSAAAIVLDLPRLFCLLVKSNLYMLCLHVHRCLLDALICSWIRT